MGHHRIQRSHPPLVYQVWRAVDQDGEVVDVYLQGKRDGAALRELIPQAIRSTEQYENNRAE
ncbi:MAG: transposase-like protein [Halioglobus sp.]|jgi:putative transposase